MDLYFAEILQKQERKFKNCIMRDYFSFNDIQENLTGFPFLETSSKDYELQKYFEVRLEHYIRTILVNEVFRLTLENKGVGVYSSELPSNYQTKECFFTNQEYERITGCEFIAEYEDKTVMYRYTDISSKDAIGLISDFEDQIIIINWTCPAKADNQDDQILPNGKIIKHCSLYDLFFERIGIDNYNGFISFLTGMVIEFQEFIGVKSVPKLSPFSLGDFRFEIEENIKNYIYKIKDFIKADTKIKELGYLDIEGIDYGYRIINEDNNEKYAKSVEISKRLLKYSNILEIFESKKIYRYLIGGSDFAKSFITSEYLYKQYDCDDCFDYTSIVSGYLKSVEQLLLHIANFSKDKGYRIKNNGKKKDDKGKKPFKISFEKENDGWFDTTIGSLIYFFDDNKSDLLIVDDAYKTAIIDCLHCYRIECRNNSFHLDNNYNWSKVENIRWNTFLVYILLLTCCKLGDTEWQTNKEFKIINDDRLERLFNFISSGRREIFEFVFIGENNVIETIMVKHVPTESSYPTYNSIGQIKSVLLTFESITDHRKVFISRMNVPEEMYYVNANGEKVKIE